MICNNCKNEYTNINGLKFCPYCGLKTEETIDLEQSTDTINNRENENIIKEETNKKRHQDTLTMPAITNEDIKKYKRDKFTNSLKNTFVRMKVIIPIIALLAVIGVGVFAYTFFIVKPVDEVRMKEDLLGKVVTLPKGTSIKINKKYIKNFSINSRNTDKSKDEIKVALTLNNGSVEANTILSLVYTYEGKNQWKFSDKIVLEGVTAINPVVGMDEKKFLEELKKLSIPIADTPITLGGQDVKNLSINLRTPDMENSKEEILVQTSIDDGLLAAAGKIKCKLIFENEAWSIATIEENSTEDFKLVLSPSFSEENIIETIKKQGLNETVSYSDFFGGKGYAVKDSFTKGIKISSKKFDAQKGTLKVTAKRENIAGEIKSVLSTNYTFSLSFSKISLLSRSKTTVDSGTINNVTSSLIISTIDNVEIEGSNLLFWFSNSHRITTEEAKTFKTDKILSAKGFQNIKYVYGNINLIDRKKSKNVSFVALYFLVYDGTNGYNWKLEKIVGEDSPNYKEYSKEAQ